MTDPTERFAGTLDDLKAVSTATLSTQLFKRGFRQQFIVNVRPFNRHAATFAGEASTVRFIPAREDLDTLDQIYEQGPTNLQWSAIENTGPGQALVIDSREDIRAASCGEILVRRLMARGASAVVTDGAFRDGPAIARLPFPAYARAMTATTRLAMFHVADLQVPIGCGGVAVFPGDIVVGDAEGVVVIPRHLAMEIAQQAVVQERLETHARARIDAGEPLWGVYPPAQDLLHQTKSSSRSGG